MNTWRRLSTKRKTRSSPTPRSGDEVQGRVKEVDSGNTEGVDAFAVLTEM